MFSRRDFFRRIFSSTLIPFAAGCGKATPVAQAAVAPAPAKKSGRVIILGFDGVEPSIVDTMLAAGELPNLAKLRDMGCYQRLATTNPPQSPTAWSSFITCTNPGNHGIYDFLRRDPKTYIPDFGFGTTKNGTLGSDGALAKPAEFISNRKGTTFWSLADAQGIRCKLLTVPYGCPAEDLHHAHMLCGLDIPDIRGTQSTFFSLSDTYTELESVAGGVNIPLKFVGSSVEVKIPGIRHLQTKQLVEVPVKLTVDRAAHTVTFEVQGQTQTVEQGKWSKWVEWSFAMTPKYAVRAASRFNVIEAADHVKIYMTCLQIHPKDPLVRISTPGNYAAELADRYGLYKTVGWAYDTKALQQDAMTDEMFLEDERETTAWHEQYVLDEMDAGQFDLLIAGWTSTDRVAHMFWRFRDPKHPQYTPEGAKKHGRRIEETYAQMDEIVGKAMAKAKPDDLVIVMSDHGFKAFRKAFSINTWLMKNGYLAVNSKEKFLQGFDWTGTKAYGLGLGGVYLNMKGREAQGTVAPEHAPALLAELREKLLAVTDPDTGEKVFSNIYFGKDEYKGLSASDAPDIQLAYNDGYQTDKASSAGAAPDDILSPNDDKWSAEHAAADAAKTPGILFSNRKLPDGAGIMDIGPSVLKFFGIPAPKEFEGKTLI